MPLFGPPNVRCLRSTRNVKGLIRALTYQKDRDVRVAAAEPRDERAVQALTQTLAADEPYLRINGARALGEAGQPDAVEPLIGLLSDDDMHVKGGSRCPGPERRPAGRGAAHWRHSQVQGRLLPGGRCRSDGQDRGAQRNRTAHAHPAARKGRRPHGSCCGSPQDRKRRTTWATEAEGGVRGGCSTGSLARRKWMATRSRRP